MRCAKPIPKAWRRGPRCWTISPPGCRPAATPTLPAPPSCARHSRSSRRLPANAGWSAILRLNLSQRLDALIEACEDGLELRSNVSTVMQGGVAGYTPHLTPAVLHRDHGMALRSALAAVVTILLCCAFWIFTAWPSGAAAPMMAGVACCFFAAGQPGAADPHVRQMDGDLDAGGRVLHHVRAAGGAQLRNAGAGAGAGVPGQRRSCRVPPRRAVRWRS
jgi:hypothetical protein